MKITRGNLLSIIRDELSLVSEDKGESTELEIEDEELNYLWSLLGTQAESAYSNVEKMSRLINAILQVLESRSASDKTKGPHDVQLIKQFKEHQKSSESILMAVYGLVNELVDYD
tara:strand:- start:281 stop:625 length:345 start_codon:yes stop_codon:yes gene_type:complete